MVAACVGRIKKGVHRCFFYRVATVNNTMLRIQSPMQPSRVEPIEEGVKFCFQCRVVAIMHSTVDRLC